MAFLLAAAFTPDIEVGLTLVTFVALVDLAALLHPGLAAALDEEEEDGGLLQGGGT